MNGYITRIQSLESENQKSENQGGRGNPDEKLSVFFFSGIHTQEMNVHIIDR